MTLHLKIFLIISSVTLLLVIIKKVKQSKLKMENSILWIFLSIVLLFMSIFDFVIDKISLFLGFQSTPNFVFFAGIIFLFIHALYTSITISILNNKIKNLNHYIAISEYIKSEDLDEKQKTKKITKVNKNV